jgi:hypothetical protein
LQERPDFFLGASLLDGVKPGTLFGDLHVYGLEGVQFYTRAKVVTSQWPDPATSAVDLGFPQVR